MTIENIIAITVVGILFLALTIWTIYIQFFYDYKIAYPNKKNPYYKQINELNDIKEKLLKKEVELRNQIKTLQEELTLAPDDHIKDIEYKIATLKKERFEIVKELNKITDQYSQIRELYNKSENAHT